MKTQNQFKKTATVLAVLALALLSGCGSGDDSDANNVVGGIGSGSGTPASGGGACIVIGNNNIPQVSFNINGAIVDSASITAGKLPMYGHQEVGQVYLNGGGQNLNGGNRRFYGSNFSGDSVDFTVSVYSQGGQNINIYGPVGQTQANAFGVIRVGGAMASLILSDYGYGMYGNYSPYSNYSGVNYNGFGPNPFIQAPQQAPCITNVGLNMTLNWSQGAAYYGHVFLYMNRTLQGYVLAF